MNLLEMSPQVFSILTTLIEERIGLHYSAAERELLWYKISSRATEAGFYSLLDYYYHLRYDDPDGIELTSLTDALVINETYFFRELAALEQVIERHVVPLCARKVRPRIWCAAGQPPHRRRRLPINPDDGLAGTQPSSSKMNWLS